MLLGAEHLRAIILDAFRSAAPHLCEPSKIKEVIEELVERADSIKKIIDELQRRIIECCDVTRKTDLKIFLMFLEKEVARRIT